MTDLNSLLLEAAIRGDTKEMKRLIAAGADVNAKTPEGMDLEMQIGRALSNGAGGFNLPAGFSWDAIYEVLGDARLSPHERQLFAACEAGDTEAAARLIAGKVNINVYDGRYKTPMMVAAMRGDDRVVALLLDAGADPGLIDMDRKAAYELACDRGATFAIALFRHCEVEYRARSVDPVPILGGTNGRWYCPFCGRWGGIGASDNRCPHYLVSNDRDWETIRSSALFDGPVGELVRKVEELASDRALLRAALSSASAPTRKLVRLIAEEGSVFFAIHGDGVISVGDSEWYFDFFKEDAQVYAQSLKEQAAKALDELRGAMGEE